ncbi:MAG: MurR/RpiR family transcriptional regulator [Erysipelotrichaceae bacterium]|nr:MurR/RpiR family transcriptional regulator [Erysipelotrichaceae bacterium]
MDFYEKTSKILPSLSSSEQVVFNYVIKNLHVVKDLSIRELADRCFISTTTLFRFVKKLGYEGYSDFIDDVREAEFASRKIEIPNIVANDDYRDSYLKNVIEAVKVITDEKIDKFEKIMSRNPNIYILAEGLSAEPAQYFRRLLISCGYNVEIPSEEYAFKSILKKVKKDDVLLVLSYNGNNRSVIHKIERIFAISTPNIISITRSDNNAIQNMSDLNFYVFADEIEYEGEDITSRIGMIAIMEILLYKRLTSNNLNGTLLR